jgi:hypothetical protein
MSDSFKEIQRFKQRWLWLLLVASFLVELGVFGYGLFQQLVLGEPWGDRPMSDLALILVSCGVILLTGGLIYLFYCLRLITEVRPNGLYVRYYPLQQKIIPYHKITACEARTYKPLREYGGWGIKYGRSGWAYNVSGDQGVQLELDDGKRVLVGSQRAEDLARAIKRYCPS